MNTKNYVTGPYDCSTLRKLFLGTEADLYWGLAGVFADTL